jgi:DNA-binding response OmpR family regulator
MKTIFIIDDESIVREPIAVSLRALGYRVRALRSITQSRALMERSAPDMVILEFNMACGRGAELLEWMRSDPRFLKTPVLLLTDSTDIKTISVHLGSGKTEYLVKKTFSITNLFERVQSHIGLPTKTKGRGTLRVTAKPASQLASPASAPVARGSRDSSRHSRTRSFGTQRVARMSEDECIERIRRFSARAFSPAVAEVIRMTSSPDAQRDELVDVLRREPALTSRILHASNSATIGRRSVASIDEAVTVLGFARVRKLAASIGIFAGFSIDRVGDFDPLRLWQHSIAVAVIMELLGKHMPDQPNYMVGLCHDLGSLAVWNALGPALASADGIAKKERSLIEQVDVGMFGTTRTELACTAIDLLGLPTLGAAAIKECIRDPGIGTVKPLVRRLHAADAFAHALLWCWRRESPLLLASDLDGNDAAAASGINWSTVDRDINAAFSQLAGVVAGSPPPPEAIFTRRPCRIVYTHPDKLSSDPIHIAIASLSDVVSGSITARSVRSSTPHALIATLCGRDHLWNQQALNVMQHRSPHCPVMVINGSAELNSNRAGVAVIPARPTLSQLDEFIAAAVTV